MRGEGLVDSMGVGLHKDDSLESNTKLMDVFDKDKSTHKSSLKQGILEILKRLS